MISVLCTIWGKRKNGCRKFMYFLCFIIFFLCIFAFIICLVSSLINPATYYSCEYINENLRNRTKFEDTMIRRFNIEKT